MMDPISSSALPVANSPAAISPAAVAGAASVAGSASSSPAQPTGATNSVLSSTTVDISPLGQFLSNLALSRKQLLTLQGSNAEAAGARPPGADVPGVSAVAQQLADAFAQLYINGIDAAQLSLSAEPDDAPASRFAQPRHSAAQPEQVLNRANPARIGINLPTEPRVDTAIGQLTSLPAQEADIAPQPVPRDATMNTMTPLAQDPSVAAAIAAYNLSNSACNPALLNRQPASDLQKPLLAPVAAVERVKPVKKS